MNHTALGKSFEIVNLCEKNNSNVHFCWTTKSFIGEKAECTDAQKRGRWWNECRFCAFDL